MPELPSTRRSRFNAEIAIQPAKERRYQVDTTPNLSTYTPSTTCTRTSYTGISHTIAQLVEPCHIQHVRHRRHPSRNRQSPPSTSRPRLSPLRPPHHHQLSHLIHLRPLLLPLLHREILNNRPQIPRLGHPKRSVRDLQLSLYSAMGVHDVSCFVACASSRLPWRDFQFKYKYDFGRAYLGLSVTDMVRSIDQNQGFQTNSLRKSPPHRANRPSSDLPRRRMFQ